MPRTIRLFLIFATASMVGCSSTTDPPQTASKPDKSTPAETSPTPIKPVEPPPPKPVPFDIQGMRIGDRLTEEFRSRHCRAEDKGKPDVRGNDSIEIDGKRIFILFQFDDFKLVGVSLTFDPSAFDSIIDAYTDKFGVLPHYTKTTPVKTRLGASYTNVTARWITESGPFEVCKYGDSVDKGFAWLQSPEFSRYLERKQSQKRSQDAEKLRTRL